MDKTLKLLANVPIDDALSAIHDVLRGLKYHFDKSDFERLIGSKYSEAATPSAGKLAVRLRKALERETGHDLDDLADDEEERLTARLATLGQELARKSFGFDASNAKVALEAFRREKI